MIPVRTRKGKRTSLAKLTPIAQWILKERLRTIDPRTGIPYSEREVSKQAGLDVGAVNRYMHGAQPTTDACLKLALFFSVYPDHVVNPDFLLHITNHRPDPNAPEIIPPKEERLTDEEADAFWRRLLGAELEAKLIKLLSSEKGIALLSRAIDLVEGLMEIDDNQHPK